MTCTIYIVEDHEFVRQALCRLLETEPGISVCGSAGNAEDALDELDRSSPDLVLIDISLPTMGGIELTRRIVARHPEIRCLMYSGFVDPSYVEQAMRAGARGYVVKDDPVELRDAIDRVMEGGRYVSRRS